MDISKVLRQELRLDNLRLNFEEPSYFVRSQWSRCGSNCFVLYRLTLAGYFVIWLIWTCVQEALLLGRPVLLYFTTWVLFITATHAMFAALATFYHHVIRTRPGRRGSGISRDVDFPMSVSTEPITLNTDGGQGEVTQVNVITGVTVVTPWFIRVTWLLYNVTLVGCGTLTLLYWPLVYDGHLTDTKLCNNLLSTLVLLVDLLVTRVPLRLLHVVYPAVFFTVYVIFNVLVSLYGRPYDSPQQHHSHHQQPPPQQLQQQEPIYAVLDWRQPLLPSAGVCVVTVLVLPLVQLGWYMVYQLRLYLWRRYGQAG